MSDRINTEEAQEAIREAVLAFQTGDLAKALELSKDTIAAHPKHPVAHNVRGVFLLENSNIESALEAFSVAINLRPDYAEAQNNCGIALSELLHHDLAIEHFRRALALKDSYAEAHNNLALSLEALGKTDQALERMDKAIALMPDYLAARFNRAKLLADLGRHAEARVAHENILQTYPGLPQALLGLVQRHQFQSPEDPLLEQMHSLKSEPGLDANHAAALEYALARASDQLGDLDSAFGHWTRGAALRKSILAYDPEAARSEVSTLISAFSKLPDPAPAPGEITPLFIVGAPRSGLTLAEQMLGQHSRIALGGEMTFLEPLIRRSNIATRHPTQSEAEALADNFRARMPQFAQGAGFVIDKTPGNFLWVGHVLKAMPEAKILHLSRDPRAAGWAMFRNDPKDGAQNAPTTLPDIARHIEDVERMMAHWHRIAPGRIHQIRYEDLIADPKAQLSPFLTGLGLAWEPEILAFADAGRAVPVWSSQPSRPGILPDRNTGWRRYERYLGPLLESLREAS